MTRPQCTETSKQLLQELKTTLAQIDPAYAEEQLAYDQAAAQLSDHTFAEVLETQFAAKLLYVTWQGFCWNLDCYRNPVNKLRLHTDYEELHGESYFPSLPKVRAAEEAIRAAALLLPRDAILDGMFLFSLGEHINTLSRKYTPNKYDNFCYLATALGVSQSALAYRMEQLGLLDRCFLYKK